LNGSSSTMALSGKTDTEKFQDLGNHNYKFQAIWFLNAYWKTFGEKEAENVWAYGHKMIELDKDKKADGCAVDEFQAHRFLEIFQETLTVLQMREKLVTVGIDKVKLVPLCHYLVFKFSVDWHYLVNAPQGDNQEEVEKAQRMLAEVLKALEVCQRTAEQAVITERESAVAAKAAKEAKSELVALENAYNNKTAELERKSQEGAQVAQSKAKAELAQHKAGDPLPLRKARITNEAAVKRTDKASKAAEEARAAADAAVIDTRNKVDEAEAYLNEVKSRPGSAGGVLWWIDRELHEARAYLPTSKGGYAKKAPPGL